MRPETPTDLTLIVDGPASRSREARLALARSVADRVVERYGTKVLFCALYGSVARETDGPCSDVELFCTLSGGAAPCQIYEWLEGGIKVKLRVYTEAGLAQETANVDPEWPLSHNKIFFNHLLVGGPEPLERLRQQALGADPAAFAQAVTHLWLAEVFELTAKLYNLCATPDHQNQGTGPVLIKLLEQVATILGMAERRCFSTRQRMLAEAAAWGVLPGAFPVLCHKALAGNWQDGGPLEQQIHQMWLELGAFLRERDLLLPSAISPFF
ncbi:MAG: kanamycin nucleotidyltransferase C-terminal domain-containing protein [Saprospiraceae bacterium]